MINIPSKVRIGSIDYNVDFTQNMYTDEGLKLLGQIDFDKSSIALDDTVQGPQSLEITFLHELIHGMLYSVNSEHTHNEILIDELSKALHQVIKDNIDIFIK